MNLLSEIKSKLSLTLWKFVNKKAFEDDFLRNIPTPLKDASQFPFYRNTRPDEKRIAKSIESYRSRIINLDKELHSFSSPHSGTFSKDAEGRAGTGDYAARPAKRVAMTGANMKAGILLMRIINGMGARRILELGTNTGFSGCYFLSCPGVEELVTIEGSKDLCEIAARNLDRISGNHRIMNMLFDDAIDQLSQNGEKFDCVFIDGQHEREATWHYTKKTLPLLNDGGFIIFDDIYWSDDMNRFWKEVCLSPYFSQTIDLQSRGVAILSSGKDEKMHYDVCEYIGRPSISRKGW